MNDPTDPTRTAAKPTSTVQSDEAPPAWRKFVSLNTLGVLLLLAAAIWSLVRVLSIKHENQDPNAIILRIAHWQLESGFRDGLQEVIDDYQALHADRNIKIIQMGVTERVYAQWLNVNLIAGKAPDLAEMGSASLTTQADNLAKYFLPLGSHLTAPNPYNQLQYLDELENRDPGLMARLTDAPWRETLVDGMRGGWRDDLQDFYSVPTAFFTQRMFYNKTLFKKVLGHDRPPESLAELLNTCEQLRVWAEKEGGNFSKFNPIAGTRYHRDLFVNKYRIPFTYPYQDVADIDLSCDISSTESWIAFQTGTAKVEDPAYKAYLDVVRTICEQFNPNFAAMDRDQAIADFAQQRAAFMASGSWDAASVFLACDFEVGICDLPLPKPGEEYGEYGHFGLNEASTNGGAMFGVPKSCEHPEIALDFLRFLTSHKWNQKFNRLNGFLPITIGTRPSEAMVAFMPNPYGVLAHLNWSDGYDLQISLSGSLDKFLGGEIDFDTFTNQVDLAFADTRNGFDRIWYKTYQKTADNARSLERTIAVLTASDLFGKSTGNEVERARQTILDQSLSNYGGNIRLFHHQFIKSEFPEAP